MIGTSAELMAGSQLTIKELLYGMMLPSGNDAAYVLAEYIGTLLCLAKASFELPDEIHSPERFLALREQTKKCVIAFTGEMNRRAGSLGMTRTHYSNPHGLSDKDNYSTCWDLARLCSYAMENKELAHIVATKEYSCLCPATAREYRWTNTHKLLDEGWHGIKTGVTPAAGPCLASYYRGGKHKHVSVLIVLLCCDSMDLRYEETRLLLEHIVQSKTHSH